MPRQGSGGWWLFLVPAPMDGSPQNHSRRAARDSWGQDILKYREAGGEQGLREETRSKTETHWEDSYSRELEH